MAMSASLPSAKCNDLIANTIYISINYMNLRYIIHFLIALSIFTEVIALKDLDSDLKLFRDSNQIRGIQLEITKGGNIIYHANLGEKNE